MSAESKTSSRCPDGNPACDGSDVIHGDWCSQARIIQYRCPNGHRSSGRTDSRGVYLATVECPECGATATRNFRYVGSEAGRFLRVYEAGLDEEMGRLIVALEDLTNEELERLLNAVQMIDAEAQDVLEARFRTSASNQDSKADE
jgi:hypothetical protein